MACPATREWHLKYRPKMLWEVIGQDAVVTALRPLISEPKRIPRAILFVGPSGTGKTTLARIIAHALGCAGWPNLYELDAASYSGVADIRQLVWRHLYYRALAVRPEKIVILDECHAFSSHAWQALLQPLEEPHAHVYWCLCTTEPEKVPATIRSRCRRYGLRPIATPALRAHLEWIAKRERVDVNGCVLDLCAKQARGNVRQAIVNLETIADCGQDLKTARELLRQPSSPQAARRNGAAALGKLVDEGLSQEAIAERLDVSRTTVWRRKKRAGLV